MAAIRPIPFPYELRSQDSTYLSDDDSSSSSIDSDSDSDSDVSSSEVSSSASSASSSDSSDQESDADSVSESNSSEEEDTGHSDDEIRPASILNLTEGVFTNLLDTLGDMARTDNLGYIAWLVPFTGICTMLGTELLACVNHFSCYENFPTLSYAATFRPEGYAFTGGMCLTAMFILASVVLFFWYLQLRRPQQLSVESVVTGYVSLVAGVTAALSLFGLAVMDMRTHHDAHINFTIAFFIAAWVTMIAVQSARKSILHEDEIADDDGKASAAEGLLVVVRRHSFWLSLRRWRRLDFNTAYNLGRLLFNIGLASTFLFGLSFLCANGVWPNPLGFTAVQEAFFEALAIVCQLLFMGTLSCELARLARLVEHIDYAELEKE